MRASIASDDAPVLCGATAASTGVAIGALALDVAEAKRLARHAPVILVRHETTTDDIGGLAVASGLLTAVGGRTSHAAVVARQLDKVCLVGCMDLRIDLASRSCHIGGRRFFAGEQRCLDANEGRVIAGKPRLVVEKPLDYHAEVERWRQTSTAGLAA